MYGEPQNLILFFKDKPGNNKGEKFHQNVKKVQRALSIGNVTSKQKCTNSDGHAVQIEPNPLVGKQWPLQMSHVFNLTDTDGELGG